MSLKDPDRRLQALEAMRQIALLHTDSHIEYAMIFLRSTIEADRITDKQLAYMAVLAFAPRSPPRTVTMVPQADARDTPQPNLSLVALRGAISRIKAIGLTSPTLENLTEIAATATRAGVWSFGLRMEWSDHMSSIIDAWGRANSDSFRPSVATVHHMEHLESTLDALRVPKPTPKPVLTRFDFD